MGNFDKNLRELQELQNAQAKILLEKDDDDLSPDERGTITGFFGQMFLGAVNSSALGAPRFILDRNNRGLFEKSKSKGERIGRGTGTAIGFILGAPLKVFAKGAQLGGKVGISLAKGAIRKKAGVKFGSKEAIKSISRAESIGSGAGGFALGTAVEFPEEGETFGDKIIDVPISTALGGAFGFAGSALTPLIKKHTGVIKEFLADKVPKEALKDMGTAFAKDMAALKKSTDKHLKNLVNSKKFKEANEFIEKTYVGAVQNAKSIWLSARNSEVVSQVKANRDKILSSDFVTSVRASLKNIVDTTKDTQLWKDLAEMSRSGYHNFVISTGASHLWKSSVSGKKIVTMMKKAQDITKDTASPLVLRMMKSLGALSKKDRALFEQIIQQDLPVPVALRSAVSLWKEISSGIGKELQQAGFEQIVIKQGKVSLKPLTLRQRFFPHQQIDRLSTKEVQEQTIAAAMKREGMTRQEIEPVWKAWNNWLEGKGTKDDAMVKFLLTRRSRDFKNVEAAVDTLTKIKEARMSPILKHHDFTGGLMQRMGSIKFTRPVDLPFYDVDPTRALQRYILGSKQQLAQRRMFGNQVKDSTGKVVPGRFTGGDEKLIGLLNKMQKEGGDANLAQYLLESLRGTVGAKPAFGFISRGQSQALRGAEVVTKLGLSAIANASQSVGTAMFTDIHATAKSLSRYLSSKANRVVMQETASGWGVTFESGMSEAMQGLGSDGSFTILGKVISPSKFLKKTGFLAVERMNRVVSAHAAKDFLIRMSKEYVKNPNNKVVERAIRRMGVNPRSIIKNRGIPNPGQIARAARETEAKTQFQTGLLDIPLWWNSPEGKLMTQFKVFSFKQAQLIKTVVLDEAAKGNMRPLATALILMPIIGEGVKDARSIVTLRKRNDKGLERLAENMAAVGAGGIFMDILQQNKFGNIEGFLVGPIASDLGKAIQSGIKAGQGKSTKAENMLLKNIPIVGPALQNLRRNRSGNPGDKLQAVLDGIRGQ